MNLTNDWLYDQKRMEFRERCLSILLQRFGSELKEDGSPAYSSQSIYECAHDWVSQGNVRPDGIVAYYEAYYGKS
tara:strand:- start:113 stop:337 length:225 start_codon:yes stop_codon:yes gene_type:complete